MMLKKEPRKGEERKTKDWSKKGPLNQNLFLGKEETSD